MRVSPGSLGGGAGVVQGVEELPSAELAHLIYPVARERGGADHQGRQGIAVRRLGLGILLCPTHTHTLCL